MTQIPLVKDVKVNAFDMPNQARRDLVFVALRNAILDIDVAVKEGQRLEWSEVEKCRDILSGILDEQKVSA